MNFGPEVLDISCASRVPKFYENLAFRGTLYAAKYAHALLKVQIIPLPLFNWIYI